MGNWNEIKPHQDQSLTHDGLFLKQGGAESFILLCINFTDTLYLMNILYPKDRIYFKSQGLWTFLVYSQVWF